MEGSNEQALSKEQVYRSCRIEGMVNKIQSLSP